MSETEELTEYEQKIIDNVAEHGWHCVAVFGGAHEFAYTVGFSWDTLRAPEVIICGLPRELMHSMLWSTFRLIKEEKRVLADGERWPDLLADFDCISRPVHSTQLVREYFNSALWYRRHRTGSDSELKAFQLFWPAVTTGLFPWEHGCSQEVRDRQPQLYLPMATGIA